MHTMHLLPGVAKQPNLELKTQPKQLLGSLPLVITLPRFNYNKFHELMVIVCIGLVIWKYLLSIERNQL